MSVVALFSTSFFAKCLGVGEDGPKQGHLCHTDTFLVKNYFMLKSAEHEFCFVYYFLKLLSCSTQLSMKFALG